MPTFQLRRPTPTQRIRGSATAWSEGGAIAPERGGHLRLDARLDDHHLGALAEAPHELDRLCPRDVEARRTDVVRLHRRRGIEHHHDLAGALAHHRGGRPRQRDGQREEGEDLEDQQRIALEPLKERRRLAVAQRRIPQEQARHPPLAPADLEEIEQDERQDERREGKREGREEAHTSSRPRICASTNSSTGVSVVTRWYPISWVRLNVSARSRNCRRRSW